MVRYELVLEISELQEYYRYTLDLTRSQENNPQDIFTTEIKEDMRKTFQKNSQCEVDDMNLKKMTTCWAKDIAEGYKKTRISLNLPSFFASKEEHQTFTNEVTKRAVIPKHQQFKPNKKSSMAITCNLCSYDNVEGTEFCELCGSDLLIRAKNS